MLFSSPEFFDESSGMDLLDNIDQLHLSVMDSLFQLEHTPTDKQELDKVNQSVSHMKSLLLVSKINALVPLIQSLEDILEELTVEKLKFTDSLSDIILLIVVLLRDAVEKYTLNTIDEQEFQQITDLCQYTAKIVTVPDSQVSQQIDNALDKLLKNHQFVPQPLKSSTAIEPTSNELPMWLTELGVQQHDDILLMLNLASSVESRSPRWHTRTEQITKLALLMNQQANNPCDTNQLAMAAITHDFGMAFLPLNLLNKDQPFDCNDNHAMRDHLRLATEPLKRLGWPDACEMVLQHHEQYDGSGYPVGLKHSQICDGAKILTIADSYFACVVGNEYRQQRRRPLRRAIMEINRLSETRFCPFWVKMFNLVTTQ
jgi:HD-GYP domain-containing protein (c-di-GMP phosphodiesterase class II)